ncbi:hypothetical protein [Adhaeribacter pallidiroseus]|uniref:Uncharacterized protein n=1 Tax=Adhaeribacter pallidiroseus TaxID=2072847 RepID=A0A369Q7B6_9BACT|nr:hypothetical protein [Adhaeribacter pallidiroseus]RDC58819.1 hypothetical protein AHMF7616_05253 [Adhaeribacter pallidiroseus]
MAEGKKSKSFAGLVKPTHALSNFDKEMVGMDEANVTHEKNDIHEMKVENELTPFSTRISKGTYAKVRQYEYWERATITEIVELALIRFLEDKESAIRPLPEKELKRLEDLSRKKKKGSKK